MQSKNHRWAVFYLEKMGWSIIPINPDGKRPLLKKKEHGGWKPFQTRKPTREEVDQWWDWWPDANIGLITGSINDLSVLDVDEHEVPGTLEYLRSLYYEIHPGAKQISETEGWWEWCWSSKTANGGFHFFFKYDEQLVSKRHIPAVDIKSKGGYVIIPPSVIAGRKYKWLKRPWRNNEPFPTVTFPMELKDIFNANPSNASGGTGTNPTESPARSGSTDGVTLGLHEGNTVTHAQNMGNIDYVRTVTFDKGGRDESLFHIANTLFRGGMSLEGIRTVVHTLADQCNPPFKDAEDKIISALSRDGERNRALADEIKEWVANSEGIWTVAELDRELLISSKKDKKNRKVILSRLAKDGYIVRPNSKHGVYRRVETDLTPLNYVDVNEDDTYEAFEWPLGIETYFRLMPKNVVIVSGAPDTGKTAFMLSTADKNQDIYPVNYFSSEMGNLEFQDRLSSFHWRTPEEWSFLAFEREENFSDVIKPDEVNIIDFLEIYDNFYQVGKLIKDIWSKLDKGVAIIAIQKNQGAENPIGGNFARQKARLVLNLDREKDEDGWYCNKAEITKAKNWKTIVNPSGLVVKYDLLDGCQFSKRGDWKKKWEK